MVLQGVPSYVNIASKAAKYNNLVIRMQQWGCNNRPFYHVVVDKVCHPRLSSWSEARRMSLSS